MSRLDPAALQVLISRLTGIAEEMGEVLRRAAFSPNIKERADCSAALFTPNGELLVQAEHMPVHLGSMPASVAAAIEACGTNPEPGQDIILNDPFHGGTHLNDITLVTPCHADGELIVDHEGSIILEVSSIILGWVHLENHGTIARSSQSFYPSRNRSIILRGL